MKTWTPSVGRIPALRVGYSAIFDLADWAIKTALLTRIADLEEPDKQIDAVNAGVTTSSKGTSSCHDSRTTR